ncbi:MAG: EamA family transporter [Proteobacteria bacterium]|nr:EamA family transporter [Pseudomonadota bacterium]
MPIKAYAALLSAVIVWGVAPAFIRSFSLTAGPADSMFIRLVTVALFCLPFLPFAARKIARQDWPRLLLVAWVGVFGYFLGSIFGFTYVGSGVGGLIMATQPLIIALLASALGTERLTIATLAGLAVSFAGALYLFSGDLGGSGTSREALMGALMIFACGIAFAINVVFSRPLVRRYGSLTVTLYTMMLCAIPALPFYNANIINVVAGLDLFAWGSLIYLSLVGTILAVIAWNYAVGLLRPTTVGASLYVIPLLAVISGWIVLGEKVTIHTAFAGLIIVGGVALSEFGQRFRLKGPLLGLALVIFAVTMWGLVPVAMRFLLLDVSPQTAMVLRLYPSAVVAACIVVAIGWKRLTWREWLRVTGAALLGSFAYQVLAAYGMHTVPASWTGMLFGLEPVFIALGASLFVGEKLTSWFAVGLAIALAGTAVLMLGSASGSVQDVSLFGLILVTLSTFGWAIYTLLIKPVSVRHGAFLSACLALVITALPLPLFVNARLVQETAGLSGIQWLTVGFVSVFATVLATGAWNTALGHMKSATAGMFLYVQPIVAAIGGILLLGERLSIWLLAGGLLICLGVAISQIPQGLGRRITTPDPSHHKKLLTPLPGTP